MFIFGVFAGGAACTYYERISISKRDEDGFAMKNSIKILQYKLELENMKSDIGMN